MTAFAFIAFSFLNGWLDWRRQW